MTSTKLGHRLSSSLLATALCFAPVNGVIAAPAAGEEGEDAADTEGEEAADTEGEEAADTEGEETAETEGEETAETEGEEAVDTEGEEAAETEGEEAVETEGEEAAETEGEEAVETEGEEATEIEAPPPEPEGPQRPPEPTWGAKGQHAMNGKGMLIAGGVTTGLGAAFIVTAVLVTRCDFESSLSCKYGDQRSFLVPTAVAATGLGLMLVGVGLGNRAKYKKWQNWTPEKAAFTPTFMRGGGGVAVAGRF